MSSYYWLLPTAGDSRHEVGHFRGVPERSASASYLRQIAAGASLLKLDGLLLPTGLYCEDPWLVAALTADVSAPIRVIIAVRPDSIHPTLAAHMAATLQRQIGPRVDLQLVAGGSPSEQAQFGDFAEHDARYERIVEFCHVMMPLLRGAEVTFDGRFYQAKRAKLLHQAPSASDLRIFIGGSSTAAHEVSQRFGDVHMSFFDGTPSAFKSTETRQVGRSLAYGTRVHVIARRSAAEARSVAESYLDDVSDDQIARELLRQRQKDSEGQRRMHAMHGGDRGKLWLEPTVWSGLSLMRGGSGAAIVGSYEDVAERIRKMENDGVDHFILSGYPHLEELYHFGENVLPLLQSNADAGTHQLVDAR